MNKRDLPRRLVCLTLAASVAIPPPVAIAASRWTEYASERLNSFVQEESERKQENWLAGLFDGVNSQQPTGDPSPTDTGEVTPSSDGGTDPTGGTTTAPDGGGDLTGGTTTFPEKGSDPTDGTTTTPGADTDRPGEGGGETNAPASGGQSETPPPTQTEESPTTPADPDYGDGQENIPSDPDLTTDDDDRSQPPETENPDDDSDSQPPLPETDVVVSEPHVSQGDPALSDGVDGAENDVLTANIAAPEPLDDSAKKGRADFPAWSIYHIGYGVPFTGGNSDPVALTGIGEGFKVNLGGKFAVEVENTQGYGAQTFNDDPPVYIDPYYVETGDADIDEFAPYHSFVVFPSASMLGRIPDMKFEGWYYYLEYDKTKYDKEGNEQLEKFENPATWIFGDEDYHHADDGSENMEKRPIDVDDYTEEKAGAYYDTAYAKFGDTWDGGKNYGYGYVLNYDEKGNVIYDPDDSNSFWAPENEFNEHPVSIVGRWVDSDISTLRDEVRGEGKDKVDYLPTLSAVVNGKVTDPNITLYSNPDMTGETTFASGQTEYYLQVDADVESLDLTFHTAELYFSKYAVKEGEDPLDPSAYYLDLDPVTEDGKDKPSPVQVTVTDTKGGVNDYITSDRIKKGKGTDTVVQMTPAWDTHTEDRVTGEKVWKFDGPNNTTKAPAHSVWTVKGINLTAASGSGSLYNKIEILVKAPGYKEGGTEEENAGKTTTYVFYVRRLAEPTLKKAPGNTPAGMIGRYANKQIGDLGKEPQLWGASSADINNKAAAVEKAFRDQGYTFGKMESGDLPKGLSNQDGTIYKGVYAAGAWAGGADEDGGNVDLDPSALVVYQNSVLLDPGFTITDSAGNNVGIFDGNVARSLGLKRAETLSVERVIDQVGDNVWYVAGELLTDEELEARGISAFQTLNAQADMEIDLRGMNILPGVYTMEYRFTDSINDTDYGSDPDVYVTSDGKDGAANFARTVVVLPLPGDVDMDGAVTMADALALERIGGSKLTGGYFRLGDVYKYYSQTDGVEPDPVAALFAYRVCDVNRDGVLDEEDINTLMTLPNLKTRSDSSASDSDYFYLPTAPENDGDKRIPLETDPNTTMPKLTLEYLGKENVPFDYETFGKGPVPGMVGPLAATKVVGGPTADKGYVNGVELNDIFWMGVSLENAKDLGLDKVKSFTFTLVYDSKYVEPAVFQRTEWNTGWMDNTGERWRYMMQQYNLSTNASTLWKGSGNNAVYTLAPATGYGNSYTTHYSTAILPLESMGATEVASRLREVTFSITLADGQTPAEFKTGEDGKAWLLFVPFMLNTHPFNQVDAHLVEMAAGMRDFTLVFDTTNKAAAYSAQDTIFGGGTENLREKIVYAGAGNTVPMGEDKSVIYEVRVDVNANLNDMGRSVDYAEVIPAQSLYGGWTVTKGENGQERMAYQGFSGPLRDPNSLPPGLEYNSSFGYIWGTPSQAGEYFFTIGTTNYVMIIEQVRLRYWADDQLSYYGQHEFRVDDTEPDRFTYSFALADLQSFEIDRAKRLGITLIDSDGNDLTSLRGKDLERILDDDVFRKVTPTFRAVVDDKAQPSPVTVTYNTEVGDYTIVQVSRPASTNYILEYEHLPTQGTNEPRKSVLSIVQRPIQVVGIVGTKENPAVLGSVYSDESGTLEYLQAHYNSTNTGITQKVTVQTYDDGIGDGEYMGFPLSREATIDSDSLEFSFSAKYEHLERDPSGGFVFDPKTEGDVETRNMTVENFALIGGNRYKNYLLVDANAVTPYREDEAVVGQVRRKKIVGIEIRTLPNMEYTYGERLGSAMALNYDTKWEAGTQQEGHYSFSYDDALAKGIRVYWVTEAEKEWYESDAHKGSKNSFVYKSDGSDERYEYRQNQLMTTDYDGRYILMEAERVDTRLNADGGVVYGDDGKAILDVTVVRAFSKISVTVHKKVLTLTAVGGSNYYGEDHQAGLAFKYDPSQLASVDWSSGLKGDGAELKDILDDTEEHRERWENSSMGYVPPKLKAVISARNEDSEGKEEIDPTKMSEHELEKFELQRGVYYNGMYNAILIWGASSKNYAFKYVYTQGDATGERTAYGAAVYRVLQRPIVVDTLVDTTSSGETWYLSQIYADTHRIDTPDLKLNWQQVQLALPEHNETSTTYFAAGGKSVTTAMTFAADSGALVGDDELYFTYTATVVPTDTANYIYSDFSKGYFDMDTDDAGGHLAEGFKEYPVQITNLALDDSVIKGPDGEELRNDSKKYILVYKSEHTGTLRSPDDYDQVIGGDPEVSSSRPYYAARTDQGVEAKAKVLLRPIKSIDIISSGKLGYTYGETYTPTQADQSSESKLVMTVRVKYDSDPNIENSDRNQTEEEITFTVRTYGEDGKRVTTFDGRGLKIYYLTGDEFKGYDSLSNGDKQARLAHVVDEDKHREMTLLMPLYVNEAYNHMHLIVVGRRAAHDNLVFSTTATARTLEVQPKPLTIYAKDVHRVYGEENGELEFEFNGADLVERDRNALRLSANAGKTDGNRLDELKVAQGYNYTAPILATKAEPDSGVLGGGKSGYDITLDKGNVPALENYVLSFVPGTLYIHPRKITIVGFTQDAAIYTIYSDNETRRFYVNVDKSYYTLSLNESYSTDEGERITLTATGDPVMSWDNMFLRLTVKFPEGTLVPNANGLIDGVTVLDASILADGTNITNNYVLATKGVGNDKAVIIQQPGAKGKVALRAIKDIDIVTNPNVKYTYGDALSLSGLSVRVTYESLGGGNESGSGTSDIVEYMGQDFGQYGLRVYYVDKAIMDATDKKWYAETIEKLYEAIPGEYVTIAPTHDSQEDGRPDRLFAHNGKSLMVVAQRSKEHDIIIDFVDQPIQVDPLPLTFTLSAADKVYDGTTQAAGTITLTNVVQHTDHMDVVYPVIGADYETPWQEPTFGDPRAALRDDFRQYLRANNYNYTFSTGVSISNDPNKPTENVSMADAWTAGYKYGAPGTLTFTYLDPNVAYDAIPAYDNYGTVIDQAVQVTGLRLAGPDAANYTLMGVQFLDTDTAAKTVEITADNLAEAKEKGGYQGSDLPTATIQKRNRANLKTELPTVEIDPHTNVVRIVYDQDLSAIRDDVASDDHRDEVHFEFALQQIVTDSGTDAGDGEEAEGVDAALPITDIIQWAGLKGKETWADFRYFGGETAPKTPSALAVTNADEEAPAYVPKEDDIPAADSVGEDTVLKGQLYQWIDEDNNDVYTTHPNYENYENYGFTLDLEAYPGGVFWPGYYLYTTDRASLARNTVYLAVVRAAETHNYNPSLALSSVEGYTPELVQKLLDARARAEAAWNESEEAGEAAKANLEKVIAEVSTALEAAVQGAHDDAQAEVEALLAAAESGSQAEERPGREAAPAVKTYRQAIEIVSTKELQGAEVPSGTEPYLVPTLEDIWFTDVQSLESKEVLDAVVWNRDPTRYRIYAWDSDLSATLDFEEPLDLSKPFPVEIPGETEGSGTVQANQGNNLLLYADITFPTNSNPSKPVESIIVRPGTIHAVLGDTPVELEVTFYPEQTRKPTVQWASTNPSVARVDSRGRVTFVGVGSAYIIATVPSNIPGAPPLCSTYILVTVVENWKPQYPDSIFDFGNIDSFLVPNGDGDLFFLPRAKMTRGEVAILLAQFYLENPTWTRTGPTDFIDLTGEEEYAEAARLLGSLGIFLGYPDGSFRGEKNISRAEFISLLVRMIGLATPDTAGQPHAFLDTGEKDTWAYAEIDAMSTQPGVLMGVGNGKFSPGRKINRAEAATFLTRLLRFPLNEEGELIIPLDVDEVVWARDPILRAVNGSQILEESWTVEEEEK